MRQEFEYPVKAQHLPSQPTTFIGRERELAEVAGLLDQPACRLLTLLGPGGCGKTRLAIQYGAWRQDSFPDGSHYVPLAPLRTPDNILGAVADVLSFQLYANSDPKQQLFSYLRDKQMLLILDNFEHLLDGATLVSDLLEVAADIKVLVTSREVLNLREEWVWNVPGMDCPGNEQETQIDQYSAVQLFVERARQVSNQFSLADAQAAVVRICRLSEGLPLAIELAASWLKVLPCEQIAAEMQHSMDFLVTTLRNVPERHQSIRAVFNHSWRLLTEEERRVFEKLSVFRGGFAWEAAEQVAGASLTIFAELVAKALLRKVPSGRYTVHELLRQYGEEQLETSASADAVANFHSVSYARFLQQRVEDLKGRRQLEALNEIEADFENVRAAWNYAVRHKQHDTIETALEGLKLFCDLRDRDRERAILFKYAQEQLAPDPGAEPYPVWGKLLARTAMDGDNAQAQLDTALQIAQTRHDQMEIAYCWNEMSFAAYTVGDFDTCRQWMQKSFALYRQVEDGYYTAGMVFIMLSRDYHASIASFVGRAEECIRRTRDLGDKAGMAMALGALGIGLAEIGQYAEAERLLYERVAICREMGKPSGIALSFGHLSRVVYFMLGDFDRARASAEEAIKIAADINVPNAEGWALAALGLLASVEDGDYHRGKQLCLEAASKRRFMAHLVDFAAIGLSIASAGLEDFEAARQYLIQALNYRIEGPSPLWMALCLPVSAMILARRGDEERAVELLALAFTHPVRAWGWMEKWPLLSEFRHRLEDHLGTEGYATAWERGKSLVLEEVAQNLLAMFQSEQTAPQPDAQSTFTTALTRREIEVLWLVAAGRSNQEIAAELVISLGTTKWYITHIYDKLGVSSRTQAVARARELKLLS